MTITIVLPTRNRAHLLPNAIRAIFSQTKQDFELIVSDNCSTDGTAQFLAGINDPRLKVVRPDHPMSMPDHWNFAYDRVLAESSGDYVLLTSDDDALTPDAIETLDDFLSTNTWAQVIQITNETYYYDDPTNDDGNRIKFKYPRPEGFARINGRDHVRAMLSTFAADFPGPGMVRRTLLQQVRDRYGKLFHPWAPDYSVGVLLMLTAGEFARIKRPLLLWGKGQASYGSGSHANPDHLMEFLGQFPDFAGSLDRTNFPKLFTVNNMVADTMLRTRELIGREADWMRINEYAYRKLLRRDIGIYQGFGHRRFDDYLTKLRPTLGMMIRGWLDLQIAKAPKRIDRFQRAMSPASIAASLGRKKHTTLRIRGADAGFSDIAAAARYYVEYHAARA